MHTEVISISYFTPTRTKWRSRHAHTVNPIWMILISFHVTGLKSVITRFHDIPIKFVGGVRQSASHVRLWSFPVARRGRYKYDWISAYEWPQGGTLIIHIKFHQYWTRYSGVISIWFFLANRSKWQPIHAHTVNPKRKILITSHVTGLKSVHTRFRDIPIKFVVGVCESASLVQFWSFPVARRGRYESDWISAYGWLQGGTLITHVKFHADWTMYSGVISIWIFLVKRSKWRPRHAQTVTLIRKILITFGPKGVKSTHTDFHEDRIKSLGGVR